jgi:hypothetical protein
VLLVLLMLRRARSRIRERWRISRFSEYGDSRVGATLAFWLVGWWDFGQAYPSRATRWGRARRIGAAVF